MEWQSDKYIELLAAIVERAHRDARGQFAQSQYSAARAQRLQREARQFCNDVLPELATWAAPDMPTSRRDGAQRVA